MNLILSKKLVNLLSNFSVVIEHYQHSHTLWHLSEFMIWLSAYLPAYSWWA